jgi:hypothetical protein
MKRASTIPLMVLLFIVVTHVAGYGQDKPFPSHEEINLVVSQARVAMVQYRFAVDQEERLMGKAAADANARDRKTLENWDFASKALSSKPQMFNGVVGFDFVLMLDKAARNETLGSVSAVSRASAIAMVRDTSSASDFVSLSKTCMDASTLLFTVREGVAALYQKYVEAEERLADRGVEVAGQCMDALKKKGSPQKVN